MILPNERVTYKLWHEDDDLLVVVKPPNRVTQPGVGHDHDSLLNGLFVAYADRLRNLGAPRDYGLVHRLDRETSGLLVVALSARAYDALRTAFAERKVRKFYWAVTNRAPGEHDGIIRFNIEELVERDSRWTTRKVARIVRAGDAGKTALTAYRVLDHSPAAALIEARPVTGRLHQVRAHLSAIGATVLGDELYGPRSAKAGSGRLALHAHRLAFEHPVTGEPIDVRTPWPADLKALLRRAGLRRPDLDHERPGDAVGEEETGVGQ